MKSKRVVEIVVGVLIVGLAGLAGAALAIDKSALEDPPGVADLANGAVLEYGTVLLNIRGSNTGEATINFSKKYKEPPLVMAMECGKAGTYLSVRITRVTTGSAQMVARTIFEKMPILYRAKIGYIVIGEPAPEELGKAEAAKDR